MLSSGGFGGVPLGFATDTPHGSAGSFTEKLVFWRGYKVLTVPYRFSIVAGTTQVDRLKAED